MRSCFQHSQERKANCEYRPDLGTVHIRAEIGGHPRGGGPALLCAVGGDRHLFLHQIHREDRGVIQIQTQYVRAVF